MTFTDSSFSLLLRFFAQCHTPSKGDDLFYKNVCWVFSFVLILIVKALKWRVQKTKKLQQQLLHFTISWTALYVFSKENVVLCPNVLRLIFTSFFFADFSLFSHSFMCRLKENASFCQSICFFVILNFILF